MVKDFEKEFYTFLERVRNRSPFAFSRFSDGELYVMQNKEVMLGETTKVGNEEDPTKHPPDDHKHFKPGENESLRLGLIEAWQFQMPGYYKGKPCRCCVREDNHKWAMDLVQGQSEEQFTWANLFVNSNYPKFVEQMVPELGKYDRIIIVCNKNAKVHGLPFRVERHFGIGPNAMINDLPVIEQVEEHLRETKAEGVLCLCAASSLSNLLIKTLFPKFPGNTFLDVGSALNFYTGMPLSRAYLVGYWMKVPTDFFKRKCVW